MKLIDYIRSLLRTCPLLENERINVDFLDAQNGSYSVNTSPAAPIVKRFIDGSSIRQYVFTFSSAELYGDVRGLNAPPRSIPAPLAFTARAIVSTWSSVSTEQGPAIMTKFPLPTLTSPISTIVSSG